MQPPAYAPGLLGCLLQDDLRIGWIWLERVFSQKYVFAVQTLERLDIAKNPQSSLFPAIITPSHSGHDGSREADINYPQAWQKRMPQDMSHPD